MEIEPLLINKDKVKQILELLIIKQTLVNDVNAPLQPSMLVFISEVRFDATRVAPKLSLSQQSLYLRFANTKFSRHIFYGHSFFERNFPQFLQIKRDRFTASSTSLSIRNIDWNVLNKLFFTFLPYALNYSNLLLQIDHQQLLCHACLVSHFCFSSTVLGTLVV